MKKIYFSTFALLALGTFLGADLADSSQIKKQKEFGPPPPITPKIAQSYMLENQFDNARRDEYFFVTNKVDSAMSPFKIASGVYNGSFYGSALTNFRTQNIYAMLNLNYTKARDYKDGAGKKVGFGYDRFNQGLILGFVPNDVSEFKFTYLHDDIRDDKQPQHGMDAAKTQRHIFKFDGRVGEENLNNTLTYGMRYRKVDRISDNFSVRPIVDPTKLPLLKMERKRWDYYAKFDTQVGDLHNQVGFSHEIDNHLGRRWKHELNSADIFNAFRFPDIHVNKYKIFDTMKYVLNEQNDFEFGLAYEYNKAKMRANDYKIPMPKNGKFFPSAREIWQYYYGINFDGVVDTDAFSAEFKYNFMPNKISKYTINLAHIERIGENPERFSSLSNPFVFKQDNPQLLKMWRGKQMNISNPLIKKEEHNFIKLSSNLKSENFKNYMNEIFGDSYNFAIDFMYDDVKNLIIFDRFAKDGAIITRNVDAKIFKASALLEYNLNSNLGFSAKGFYAYGRNDTDSKPLYQIRPLELDLNLDYKDYFSFGTYNVGSALRMVSKQTKGDFDKKNHAGVDNRDSAKGFATMDLYAGVNFKDKFGVRLGVNNIFDKKYSEFINVNHVQSVAPKAVNAPGRNVYLSFHAAF